MSILMTRRINGRARLPLAGAAVLVALVGCSTSTAPTDKPAQPAGSHSTGSAGGSTRAGATSRPSAAAQASGPADACKLVTPAEAQAALGKAVKPAKAKQLGPTGQGANCTYESTDFANGTAAGRALTITVFPHSSMSRSQFDKNYGANGSLAVPGLGDGAWYLGGVLNVYAHGANLSVAIVSLTTVATVDMLAPVTRLALQRI